jgi:MscS family membrane protein
VNLAEHVPDWMLREAGGLAIWQWVGLVVAILAGWFVGRFITWILVRSITFMVSRTSTTFDDELLAKLRKPMRAMVSLGIVRALVRFLDFDGEAHRTAMSVMLAVFAVILVWGALRSIDVMTARMTTAAWAVARPASRALLSLLGRIGKVIVIVIASIGFLAGLGFPVASLLAGLGIGGIALAFGAQKTVENLFGAVALGVDQPLREGDFVKVEDSVMGTVEQVGLRSTRIRTLDRTVVSLPNGKLADMRIETYAMRDRCRLHAMLGLVYGTTAAQLRTVLEGFERTLKNHPGIWPGDMVVRFTSFGSSSLDVEVMAWFKTSDFPTFRVWREEVLIAFMEVVEGANTSFAFPTRTIHVASAPQLTARAT